MAALGNRSPALGWAAWIAALGALTAGMVAVREHLDKAHIALLYLLLVLAGSTRGSRIRGTALAVISFLCFNFFFLPPYHTFGLHDPLDGLVLFSFLIVAAVAAQLLYSAQALAAQAEHAATLREADRLKDALIAAVSHDLRTPLTTIKALAHEIAAEGDVRAADIEEEADRLNRFVADLLDLSRLNAGALRVSREVVAAEDVLGAALQRVSGSVKREIRVDLHPPGALLLGRMDFVQSLRVLVNLIENADKYAPPETPVELSARREGDRLVFVVADRGPGIAPEESERVFAPFHRAGGAEPDAGGAGLGLSIARRLAEAQDGALRYHPRSGGGSIFVYSLPAAELAEVEAAQP
ncbi:MAG TPA: ATP-binding protein [Longimicrobiaceae bacterium]|nr:ATP-binding protein [Longimicrobiaceae bacterium]